MGPLSLCRVFLIAALAVGLPLQAGANIAISTGALPPVHRTAFALHSYPSHIASARSNQHRPLFAASSLAPGAANSGTFSLGSYGAIRGLFAAHALTNCGERLAGRSPPSSF